MSIKTFLDKLEKTSTRKFLLPILNEEVTYKKLDVIESAINKRMPNFLASKILESMKTSIAGDEPIIDEKVIVQDEDLNELLNHSVRAWKKNVIEPILDDEQLSQVPSLDVISWFLNAVLESQESETTGGGVVTAGEVANFPDKRRNKRNTKRASNS